MLSQDGLVSSVILVQEITLVLNFILFSLYIFYYYFISVNNIILVFIII